MQKIRCIKKIFVSSRYRKIRYYDRIHNKFIELFVRDEIVKVFQSYNKQIQRQNKRDLKYIVFSLDEQSNVNNEEQLRYEDIIADENSSVEKIYEQKQFNNVIWSIVDKLPEEERIIIKYFFKYGYKAGEIAERLNLTKEQFSQHKLTAINHLRILLLSDKSFTNTDYFMNSDFYPIPIDKDEIIKQIEANTYEFDIDEISELVRQFPQILKQQKLLGVKLDETAVKFGLCSNKMVRNKLKAIGDVISGKRSIEDVIYEITKYEMNNYDKDKNNRELNELRKISPDLFGLENHIETLLEFFKPYAKQCLVDTKGKDNEIILV